MVIYLKNVKEVDNFYTLIIESLKNGVTVGKELIDHFHGR